MDITPQDNTQPISDDQDLAKALAGVLPEEEPSTNALGSNFQFEETPVDTAAMPSMDAVTIPDLPSLETEASDMSTPQETPTADATAPLTPEVEATPARDASDSSSPLGGVGPLPSTGSADLDNIKLDALKELRPLMDKVELPADEKFDTYLMLIRSTDDSSLIGPAHAVAQTIADEKRKAEALLEIIKEIDYLSRKDKAA